ncbi:MAG: hypothetical protein LC687_05485 [Actinobacteria bacterium]|nr:hypothetical protein [Actinomycetota bacterium]
MSDTDTTLSPEETDSFKYQFEPQEAFRRSQEENGIIDYVDIDFRGASASRKVSVRGVRALLNRIILYFASGPGDYMRNLDHGNEFAFVYNSPVNTATQFRILATATSTMRRLFPEMTVRDIKVLMKKTGTNKEIRGWEMYMVLRHASMDSDISLNVPLGDDNLISQARDFISLR